jgi:hypothetical protein
MKKTKSFDAVGFMRSRRDRMGREMKGLTPRQQIEYIRRVSGLHGRRVGASSASRHRGMTGVKRGRATVSALP